MRDVRIHTGLGWVSKIFFTPPIFPTGIVVLSVHSQTCTQWLKNDCIVHNIYTKCHEWSSATCTLALSLLAACLFTGHTCTHTHTHTRMHAHTHTRMRKHTDAHTHTHYHVSDDFNSGCFFVVFCVCGLMFPSLDVSCWSTFMDCAPPPSPPSTSSFSLWPVAVVLFFCVLC